MQEYKRTCCQCGKVWFSSVGICVKTHSICTCLLAICTGLLGVLSAVEADGQEPDYLLRCPNCRSSNFTTELFDELFDPSQNNNVAQKIPKENYRQPEIPKENYRQPDYEYEDENKENEKITDYKSVIYAPNGLPAILRDDSEPKKDLSRFKDKVEEQESTIIGLKEEIERLKSISEKTPTVKRPRVETHKIITCPSCNNLLKVPKDTDTSLEYECPCCKAEVKIA